MADLHISGVTDDVKGVVEDFLSILGGRGHTASTSAAPAAQARQWEAQVSGPIPPDQVSLTPAEVERLGAPAVEHSRGNQVSAPAGS